MRAVEFIKEEQSVDDSRNYITSSDKLHTVYNGAHIILLTNPLNYDHAYEGHILDNKMLDAIQKVTGTPYTKRFEWGGSPLAFIFAILSPDMSEVAYLLVDIRYSICWEDPNIRNPQIQEIVNHICKRTQWEHWEYRLPPIRLQQKNYNEIVKNSIPKKYQVSFAQVVNKFKKELEDYSPPV
jgi:hypothetical protein